jgi:hypothetical protein
VATRAGNPLESRLIHSIFIAGAKFNGGTWNNKSNGKVMPDHGMNKNIPCQVGKSLTDAKVASISLADTVFDSLTVIGCLFLATLASEWNGKLKRTSTAYDTMIDKTARVDIRPSCG